MIAGQSIFGAAAGAGLPVNADSVRAWYPACTFSTFGMSSGLNSWVRNRISENSVLDRSTFLMPAGVAPCHFGPTIMKLPAPLPVVRVPMIA